MAVSPDSSEVVTSMASPSGKYLAVLREICEAPFSEKKRYVEVWEADRLKLVENVTDKHGQFYTDGMHPDLLRLFYLARWLIEACRVSLLHLILTI